MCIDFDPDVGPTTRQRWQAFWRMYRRASKDMNDMGLDWRVFTWNVPQLDDWFCVAEFGDFRGLLTVDSMSWAVLDF